METYLPPHHFANENIEDITEEMREMIEERLRSHFEAILDDLRIDVSDPNTKETPARIAKMYVREVFKGRFASPPKLKVFPNKKRLDELTVVGPIEVRSTCSHHFVPIIGSVWIGFIPDRDLLGLSKFARITEWVMARPHIQEEAVAMLADEIEKAINPMGLAVVMKAQHLCMSWRGVRQKDAIMTSSIVRGCLKENSTARKEL